MIFERMASAKILCKVRQLEAFSKSSIFAKSCSLRGPTEFVRNSSSLIGINRCRNPTLPNNTNSHLLTKFPVVTTFIVQQNRAASTTTGDHVRLWVFEKLVSSTLPLLMPAAILAENVIIDGLLAALVVMHTHWGLESIVVDYARPKVVGPLLPKILMLTLNLLSAVTLAGLFVLIYNGPGIGKAVKDFWKIGKNVDEDE